MEFGTWNSYNLLLPDFLLTIQIMYTPSLLMAMFILLVPSLSNLSTPASPLGMLTLNVPALTFQFPMHKFAQAGSVFSMMSPKPVETNNAFAGTSFGGFSNSFKSEMAYLIAGIRNLNTFEGRMLTDKMTMDIISIHNTLNMINADKNREIELKPLLAFQVRQFLNDMELIHEHLQKNTKPLIEGSNNVVAANSTTIKGDSNVVLGSGNLVVGDGNALRGSQSVVSGFNNGVVGSSGMTVGSNNQVSGHNSFVFSNNGVVTGDNSLVVGRHRINLDRLGGLGSYIERS